MRMPPDSERKGDIVLVDSTHLTALLRGTESLDRLCRNLAAMRASVPVQTLRR